MADVSYTRPDYDAALPDWDMVSTLCEGETAVKNAGKTLLPDPVVYSSNSQLERDAVYQRYAQRALFVNIVGRTRSSLIGSVFRKAPAIELPPTLAYMIEDSDGNGLPLSQLSQKSLQDCLTTGRTGLLVDFPNVSAPVSVADMQSGAVRANLCRYEAQDIINWQTKRIGGKSIFSRVVLMEKVSEPDAYEVNGIQQIRELVNDGFYRVVIWRQNQKKEWEIFSEHTPLNSSGQPWQEIPFVFIGAANNDSDIDSAPLFDMACVNRKHYQLGADWYNALYFAGQPQPVMAGLTAEWRDWLEKEGVVVGSRSILPLPVGGSFAYATVQADTALAKELDNLVLTMLSMGARLVQQGEAVKTATQAAGEQEVSHSVLSLAAENVSAGYTKALEFAMMFMGGSGSPSFKLNTDIAVLSWDAQTIGAIVSAWQSGTMPKVDAVRYLQRVGLVSGDHTPEDVLAMLDAGGLELG